jgi:uncharacterized protein (DUF433 family)
MRPVSFDRESQNQVQGPLCSDQTLKKAHPELLLPSASRKGKLTFMAATSYRYLVNLPSVCQGKTIVEGTRIGVHDVVGLILNGASVDDVCRSFPDLSRAQVYECLAYYEDHRTEIDALVAEQMSEEIR